MRKKKAQKIHFQRRSLERAGAILDHRSIADDIQGGKAKFVRKQSKRVSVFHINRNGETFTVVYDKQRKQVVTIYEGSGSDA